MEGEERGFSGKKLCWLCIAGQGRAHQGSPGNLEPLQGLPVHPPAMLLTPASCMHGDRSPKEKTHSKAMLCLLLRAVFSTVSDSTFPSWCKLCKLLGTTGQEEEL